MKNHIHRLLVALPRLCKCGLVTEVSVTLKGGIAISGIVSANFDNLSLFLEAREGDDVAWFAVDREDLRSVGVVLDFDACALAGVDSDFAAVLRHVESEARKGRAA